MTALPSVRRRWTGWAFVIGLLAAAVLVVVGLAGSGAVHEPAPRVVAASTLPAPRALPPTPAGLLAIQADDGSLAGLIVLAQAPPGEGGRTRGGTLLPLPVGAGVAAPGRPDRRRLADVYAEGGIDALTVAAGELLSLRFTVAADVDRLNLGRLLLPVGSVQATLPTDVVTADPTVVPEPTTTAPSTAPDTTVATDDTTADTVLTSDTSADTVLTGETTPETSPPTTVGPSVGPGERLLFAAGEQAIGAVDGADLLTAQRPGEAESVRFENSVAYWSAVAARVGDGLSAPGTTATTMSRFFASMLSGPLQVYAFHGKLVPSGAENPSGADLYRLDTAEVLRVVATVLPDAVTSTGAAFTVQLINPTGDPALTLEAVGRLAASGAAVVLVRELTGIPVPQTTEWSRGAGTIAQAAVQPTAEGLGPSIFVLTGAPGTPHGEVQGVDVTVVLGKSFRLLVKQAVATTVPSGTVTAVTDPNTTSVTPTTGGGA